MATNILLDTNIILDLFDSGRKQHEASLLCVKELIENGSQLHVNSDTLATTFYILRSRKKLTLEETILILKQSINICTLVSIEINDVIDSLNLCEDDTLPFNDYEDTTHYVCAKKINASLIVTNDKGFISGDIDLKRTNN